MDIVLTASNAALTALLTRRSVSPKRLCEPAPTDAEIASMVDAALHAPDHGALVPWRLIRFRHSHRELLARLFEDEKRRRDPLASAEDLQRAREHATHVPAMLAFVVAPRRAAPVPLQEQWLSAGAALGNLLAAAHALGYGAIMLSGDRCQDEPLRHALGIAAHETLAGFVSIGTIAKPPPMRQRAAVEDVLTNWRPIAAKQAT